MEYVTLNNGVEMPKLGLGTMFDPAQAEEAVYQSIMSGYRLIDTAAAYGTEKGVCLGIKKSGIDRSELFITSKLWFTENSEEGATKGLERTLKNLGTDYIDLYLIHQPLGDIYGAWRGLVKAMKEGKIRAIGVDNVTQARLAEFIEFNEVRPVINMVDVDVFNQREKDRAVFEQMGVQMEAWSPLGHGSKEIFNNTVLTGIGEKCGKSVTQIVLRWFMQRNIVAIPMTTNSEHMKQNIDIFDFVLTDEEMKQIAELDRGTGMGGFGMPADAQAFRNMMEWSKNYSVE
ncbi:aldo/keto reductase [Anaerocolumna jejuensis]|uniref:aldo/keto reductase n=1 Tax=Anaerocolumna jejuensis TaxID=259063 RepID=UPI003F7C19E0